MARSWTEGHSGAGRFVGRELGRAKIPAATTEFGRSGESVLQAGGAFESRTNLYRLYSQQEQTASVEFDESLILMRLRLSPNNV